jgi:ferric-chelate reductase [NAD(P)H]
MSPEFDRRAFRDLSYGLYIVTSLDGDRLNGQIVNTVIQVTSDPARVAVIVNKQNLTHEFISKSGLFGVSVLDESAPMTFLGPFGFRSGRDVDKLSQVQFKIGVTGCPLVLEYALSVLEAEVIDQIDLGTHTIFIGDTVNAEVLKEGRPLTYRYYQEFLKGKHRQRPQLTIRSSDRLSYNLVRFWIENGGEFKLSLMIVKNSPLSPTPAPVCHHTGAC